MTTPSSTSSSKTLNPKPARRVDPRLGLAPEERVKVNEIFYSIQGEASFAGQPCAFVRLTGCQMRCRWCDTEYAFFEGSWHTLDEVIEAVKAFECPLVEITGGEPLLQPGALPLMTALADLGLTVLLETGGGVDISAVDPRVHRILDVKCPASGEAEANRWANLAHLTERDEIKMVIADRADYEWARRVLTEYELAGRCPVYFSPVFGEVDPETLAQWILEDRLPVRFQLQVHKLLWGDRPGV